MAPLSAAGGGRGFGVWELMHAGRGALGVTGWSWLSTQSGQEEGEGETSGKQARNFTKGIPAAGCSEAEWREGLCFACRRFSLSIWHLQVGLKKCWEVLCARGSQTFQHLDLLFRMDLEVTSSTWKWRHQAVKFNAPYPQDKIKSV